MTRKTLVTGATGFLGGHIVNTLLRRGEDVVATGRDATKGATLTALGAEFRQADLARSPTLMPTLSGIDAVIHAGALSSVWGSYGAFYESNAVATMRLAEAAKREGVSTFVHISTPSIYADLTSKFGIREDAVLPTPINHYAATKLIAEKTLAEYAKRMHVVILRPRAIFGEGDVAIFPRLLHANSRTGVPFIDGGRALQDITYVGNVVDAALLARDVPGVESGRAYNITNGEPREIGALIEQVFASVGVVPQRKDLSFSKACRLAGIAESIWNFLPLPGEPLITKYSVSVLGCSTTLDISRAKAELGYEPKISVDEGIERFAIWWMQK